MECAEKATWSMEVGLWSELVEESTLFEWEVSRGPRGGRRWFSCLALSSRNSASAVHGSIFSNIAHQKKGNPDNPRLGQGVSNY